jgi:acyl dehydratase
VSDPASLVATKLGPTAWRRVTQADIDAFAEIAGDRQWIHVDVERARRESPYGTTIAHGTLTLALIDGFRDELLPMSRFRMGVNYGYERVRFPAPLLSGDAVRARLEVVDARDDGDGWWRIVQRFTVESEGGGKPVCVADSIVRALAE